MIPVRCAFWVITITRENEVCCKIRIKAKGQQIYVIVKLIFPWLAFMMRREI